MTKTSTSIRRGCLGGWIRRSAVVTLLLGAATPGFAQRRPLLTEDTTLVETGEVAIELGFDWLPGSRFTASGLEGDLLRAPRGALRVPLGGSAELQLETGLELLLIEKRFTAPLADRLTVEGETTADMLDPVVSTKVRLWRERGWRPAMGFRAATRLPVASNESGLGLDTIDFFVTLLAGQSFGATRVAANLGLGILAVPTRGTSQNDILVLGASVAREVHPSLTLVGEVHGRTDPSGISRPGQEDTGQVRLGMRYGSGPQRFDAALALGLSDVDPRAGLVLGWTRSVALGDGR